MARMMTISLCILALTLLAGPMISPCAATPPVPAPGGLVAPNALVEAVTIPSATIRVDVEHRGFHREMRAPESLQRPENKVIGIVDISYMGPDVRRYPINVVLAKGDYANWRDPFFFETLGVRALEAKGVGPGDGFAAATYDTPGMPSWTLWVGAASDDEARSKVLHMVDLVNDWYKENGKAYIEGLLAQDKAKLEEAQRALAEIEKKADSLRARMAGVDSLSQGVKDQLQAQLLMLQVDVAGARARISAAHDSELNSTARMDDVLTKQREPTTSAKEGSQLASVFGKLEARRNQAEQLVVDTEIELEGYVAKADYISIILAADKEMAALAPKHTKAREEAGYYEALAATHETMLKEPLRLNWQDAVQVVVCPQSEPTSVSSQPAPPQP